MSMSAALNNALSGLNTNARRTQVISDNVANALTPGYARRSVSIAPRVTAGEGAGVTVTGVARATDPRATGDRRRAEAASGESAALASAESRLLGSIGGIADAGSISARAVTWESALARLADSPESAALQADAAAAARGLVSGLNAASQETQRVRMDADGQIGLMVSEINSALESIRELNSDIERMTISGRDTLELRRKCHWSRSWACALPAGGAGCPHDSAELSHWPSSSLPAAPPCAASPWCSRTSRPWTPRTSTRSPPGLDFRKLVIPRRGPLRGLTFENS